MLTAVKSWLTFHLVKIASQLDGELFTRMCEVTVIAHHREAIEAALEAALEAARDVMRLEQEHDYDYNYEEEYNEITRH